VEFERGQHAATLVLQPDQLRAAGQARVEVPRILRRSQAERVSLVDDRARREVVRRLLVVLALQREQPTADHAALVGVERIGLGLWLRLGRRRVAADRRDQHQRESSDAFPGRSHARKGTPPNRRFERVRA